ncbi:hypothetical protein [Nocardioides nanhaiensis]|uniref:Uncharacterized protein n=1 Tax=Nocardioides nanhaiensis TaxID=1476871 RepID=A0ABP8VU45_9ACTN
MVLYVSNQSFDDERVRLRVTLDGQVVADQYFDVEGQHNWVRFPVRVPIGRPLELAVEADSGASLRRSLVALEDVARGVVVDYWGAGEEAFVGATVVREPVAFA